ncbi:hypothetical protein Taro_008962 [Colocasia esculenta]|uniref:Uncharacterized protein n=1 Tax=Colocasia esculenta TaxID=4460 RepID=A0A843U8M0_COLES|nr:hypothetical protein [Colocasia esculenta]
MRKQLEQRHDPQPGSGQSNTMRKQTLGIHPPRQRSSQNTGATTSRHNTNIPDLHKVGKEQPGVTPRDTKQPSENDVSPLGTATSDLHKVEGPQSEPPCTSDTPRATQCGSKPSAHTRRNNRAHGTPEQPRETRVSRHSTNIPDLHKVGKEQPGVTLRDTKQPSENDVSPPGTATSDLHKVEGPQAEPPCTSDTSRGQGTTHSGATTDGTKERVTETIVGCLPKAPRENP